MNILVWHMRFYDADFRICCTLLYTYVHLPADYVRLLKYGDSLYRCKELKRAALVSIATWKIKIRQQASCSKGQAVLALPL